MGRGKTLVENNGNKNSHLNNETKCHGVFEHCKIKKDFCINKDKCSIAEKCICDACLVVKNHFEKQLNGKDLCSEIGTINVLNCISEEVIKKSLEKNGKPHKKKKRHHSSDKHLENKNLSEQECKSLNDPEKISEKDDNAPKESGRVKKVKTKKSSKKGSSSSEK